MSERLNVDDLLRRNRFDHALLCTYTFDPMFFESYCLDRYNALSENGNITVILDQRTYDEILAAPPATRPRLANVRYLLHPVAVPGTFHPKLYLFASKDRGLLVVGSGNFTKAGLTANAELVAALRYERGKREEHVDLFRQARRFLAAVADRWPGGALVENLQDMCDEVSWIAADPLDSPGSPRLIDNLEEPIWSQLAAGISGADEVHVVSRFFDRSPGACLARVERDLSPKRAALWTQNGYTTMTSAWFAHPAIASSRISVMDCAISDDDHPQTLHAKAVAIVNGKRVRLAFGSANFTTSGILSTAAERNVEVMIVSDDVPLAACRPATLFDPSGSARPLAGKDLRTAPAEVKPWPIPPAELILLEARLTDQVLACMATGPGLSSAAAITVRLLFSDGGTADWFLLRHGDSLRGELDPDRAERCDAGTTLVQLVANPPFGPDLLSNSVLLINLRSFASGQNRSRDRRIRAATRSAAQFAAELEDLLRIGDQEALKSFFTHCDILLVNAGRPFTLSRSRGEAPLEEALRVLGDRNLRAYAMLHDAAIGFCDRHFQRMRRHSRKPTLEGIPSFMHIALAVAGVLGAQVERALIGLEATRAPLDAEDWAGHRTRLDEYLTRFRNLLELVQTDYMAALRTTYPRGAIREAIRPDLAPLERLAKQFLEVNARVVACCASTLRVQVRERLVTPPFYPKNLLGGAKWLDFATGVKEGVRWTSAMAVS